MKVEKLTQQTNVKIGETYLVACVEVFNYFGGVVGYLPVIGILHNDKAFGVQINHYHIDGRFTRRGELGLDIDGHGRTNNIMPVSRNNKTHYSHWSRGKIKWMPRECLRKTTGIKPKSPEYLSSVHHPGQKRYSDWVNTMIGKSCAGKRCPHLGTTMKNRNGQLVCPLHNLIGDKKTNKIIGYEHTK